MNFISNSANLQFKEVIGISWAGAVQFGIADAPNKIWSCFFYWSGDRGCQTLEVRKKCAPFMRHKHFFCVASITSVRLLYIWTPRKAAFEVWWTIQNSDSWMRAVWKKRSPNFGIHFVSNIFTRMDIVNVVAVGSASVSHLACAAFQKKILKIFCKICLISQPDHREISRTLKCFYCTAELHTRLLKFLEILTCRTISARFADMDHFSSVVYWSLSLCLWF